MTTESQEPTAPNLPGNEPTQAPGIDPTGQPTPQAAAPSNEPAQPGPEDLSSHDDPDLRDLHEARIAVEQAEKGKTPTAQTPTPGTPPTQPNDPAAQEPPPANQAKPPVPMIPKPRFDEVLQRAEAAEQTAAYWKGVADGTGNKGTTPQGTPQTPPPAPVDPLAEIDAKRLALAEKFDNGEITAPEWEKQRLELDRKAMKIAEDNLLQRVQVPKPDTSATDLLLEERTAQIADQHPYARLVFPDQEGAPDPVMDGRRQMLMAEAHQNVTAANPGLQNGPRADLLMRAELARLTDVYGPVWFKDANVQRPTPATPAAPAKSPITPQQRLDKIITQAQQPPALGQRGTSGDRQGISDASIGSLTDDEIAALPAHERARFTGVVSRP